MVKIKIYGKLAKKLGCSEWEFDVKTPAEALKALNVNTNSLFVRGVQEAMDKKIAYVLSVDGYEITKLEDSYLIQSPLSKNSEIIIFPKPCGSGVDPISILINIAITVVLTVVSALLMPTPDIDLGSNEDDIRKDSYLFSGAPRPAKQGLPIPVGYGEMIVYPTNISAQYVYARVGGTGGSVEAPKPPSNDTFITSILDKNKK